MALAYPVQPVVYQVMVNGVVVPDWVLDMEIHQQWGHHEIVQLRVELQRTSNMIGYVPWADNAAVQIVWGRGPQSLNNFYGYVNHYKSGDADSGTGNLQFTYYVIGVSKPMNTDVSKAWGNVTPTYIAKQIAQKYQLRCVTTSTTWVLSSIIQANESDFNFLNRIAEKTGFRFWVGNGTLYFIDPAAYIQAAGSQGVPTFEANKSLTVQDTVRCFHILKGSNLPGAPVAQRSVHGVDAQTGRAFHVGGVDPGTGIQAVTSRRVATSISEAMNVVGAWDNLSQFWIGATAELFGNTALYPGKMVYLDGNALPDGNDGFWMVASANHVLKMSGTQVATADKYMVQVQLLRNQNATLPKVKGIATLNPEFCTCAINPSSGLWVSTQPSVVFDGIIK